MGGVLAPNPLLGTPLGALLCFVCFCYTITMNKASLIYCPPNRHVHANEGGPVPHRRQPVRDIVRH